MNDSVISSPSSLEPLQPVPKRTAAAVLALVMLFLVMVFTTLGVWQLQRRVWKLDLIAKVQARLHAAPEPLDALLQSQKAVADLEYSRVQVHGRWLPERSAWVVAATELGSGYWLMMPMQQANNTVIWVNRGYVTQAQKGQLPVDDLSGMADLNGLLRKTEPRGTVLRSNVPQQGRWYSRDVQALSQQAGLTPSALLFVDADAKLGAPRDSNTATSSDAQTVHPVGGLTVIQFPNNHLQYALTWFAMAAMAAWAAYFVWRQRRAPLHAEHD